MRGPDTFFVPVLLALQFAAFGWRINREITVGDATRKTWIPIHDYFNMLSMLVLVLVAIVLPLGKYQAWVSIRTVIAAAGTLLALHPINTAAHYRLFSRNGRSVYGKSGKDFPPVTGQEWVTLSATVVLVVVVMVLVR